MNFRKLNIFFSGFLVLCSLNACVESDIALGLDFVPDSQLLSVDCYEFTVPITTAGVDSIVTSSASIGAVGYMKNNPFGLFYAGSVVRYFPAVLGTTYPENAVLDSAFLILPLSSRMVVGANDNMEQTLNLYQLTRSLQNDKYYYNNSLHANDYDPLPIAQPLVYKGGDTITMRLTSAYVQTLFDATEDEMDSDSVFQKSFKGFYVAPDTSSVGGLNGGRISYFPVESGIMVVNYHKSGEDTARAFYYYLDYVGKANFNVFKHSSSALAGNSGSVYFEGLAGVKPYIDFNNVKAKIQYLADSLSIALNSNIDPAKIVVNRAELQLKADYPANSLVTYPSMTTLAYWADSSYTFLSDTYLTNFDGSLNRSSQQYSLNLTYFTQGLFTKHTADTSAGARQLRLFPTQSVSSTYYTTVALDNLNYSFGVLKGPAAKMKFTYTLLK